MEVSAFGSRDLSVLRGLDRTFASGDMAGMESMLQNWRLVGPLAGAKRVSSARGKLKCDPILRLVMPMAIEWTIRTWSGSCSAAASAKQSSSSAYIRVATPTLWTEETTTLLVIFHAVTRAFSQRRTTGSLVLIAVWILLNAYLTRWVNLVP